MDFGVIRIQKCLNVLRVSEVPDCEQSIKQACFLGDLRLPNLFHVFICASKSGINDTAVISAGFGKPKSSRMVGATSDKTPSGTIGESSRYPRVRTCLMPSPGPAMINGTGFAECSLEMVPVRTSMT